MKSSISREAQIVKRAKTQAEDDRTALEQFGKSAVLERSAKAAPPVGPPIPVFTQGTGVRSGVDVTTNRGIYEVMGDQ